MSRYQGLKKTLLSTALGAARKTGVFTLVSNSRKRRESLLILCYHGLSLADEHEWRPKLYMTGEQFRDRLELLRRANASVLPLDHALAHLHAGSLPPRSVTITFDDGFFDFAVEGAPALAAHGFPATIYLTTHYTNYALPIANLALDYVLWKSKREELVLPQFGINAKLPIEREEDRRRFVARIHSWMCEKGVDTQGKNEMTHSLARSLGVDYEEILGRRMLQILNPDEVRELARAGFDFQLHTHRHRMPPEPDLLIEEIEQNRDRIFQLTGKSPVHFCYPSGNYSPDFFEWLRRSGVKSATTCERGMAIRQSQELRLPRVLDDSTMPSLRFESIISGLLV